MKRHLVIAASLVLAAGCAATAPRVHSPNPREPRQAVGTESGVRVDAEFYTDSLSTATQVSFKYVITNERSVAIAIADIIPVVSFDGESGVVVINVGSEVPGESLLPRLITIDTGEKRTFSTNARVNLLPTTPPRAIQLRVNFLGDVAPFSELTGITEKAVYDPKRADELFPKWVEANETVTTSALPVRWTGVSQSHP